MSDKCYLNDYTWHKEFFKIGYSYSSEIKAYLSIIKWFSENQKIRRAFFQKFLHNYQNRNCACLMSYKPTDTLSLLSYLSVSISSPYWFTSPSRCMTLITKVCFFFISLAASKSLFLPSPSLTHKWWCSSMSIAQTSLLNFADIQHLHLHSND